MEEFRASEDCGAVVFISSKVRKHSIFRRLESKLKSSGKWTKLWRLNKPLLLKNSRLGELKRGRTTDLPPLEPGRRLLPMRKPQRRLQGMP
jgi:hypothetical protein